MNSIYKLFISLAVFLVFGNLNLHAQSNQAPFITDQYGNVMQSTTNVSMNNTGFYQKTILPNDPDNNEVVLSISKNGNKGLATINNTNFKYQPHANSTGYDTVLIKATDNGSPALSNEITYVFLLNKVNTPPFVFNDVFNTGDNSPIFVDVLKNDSDLENEALTIRINTDPIYGSLVLHNNELVYNPKLGFCGDDEFIYDACDEAGNCRKATVIVTVSADDMDGDNIPDYVETLIVDTDKDGLPNYLDLDSDNDGISDSKEQIVTEPCNVTLTDSDFDGIPNYLDIDSDNDNINDLAEGLSDCDGDNIPDYLDSDNCKISSLFVPSAFTPNADGINDVFEIKCDLNFEDFQINIYDRAGSLVFKSNNQNLIWNGENPNNRQKVTEGLYVYALNATTNNKRISKSGSIVILN